MVPKQGYLDSCELWRVSVNISEWWTIAAIRGTEFDGADKPVLRQIHRNDEAFVNVQSFRRNVEGLARLDDQIGFAQVASRREIAEPAEASRGRPRGLPVATQRWMVCRSRSLNRLSPAKSL